jgi:glycogen phosphorylase
LADIQSTPGIQLINFTLNGHRDSEIKGTAYDTPILGYQSNGIILRLWKAEATESFDFAAYNLGDYYRAVEKKMRSENITKVLYPNDENLAGKN